MQKIAVPSGTHGWIRLAHTVSLNHHSATFRNTCVSVPNAMYVITRPVVPSNVEFPMVSHRTKTVMTWLAVKIMPRDSAVSCVKNIEEGVSESSV